MTTVYCENTDCRYYDTQSYICAKGAITVIFDSEHGCDDFEDYRDDKAYREKYYAAVNVNGTPAKELRRGRKILYRGRAFFTEDRVTEDGTYKITDKRTGYSVGTFKNLKSHWEQFLEKEKRLPDVETYPLAVRQNNGKYKLTGEGE